MYVLNCKWANGKAGNKHNGIGRYPISSQKVNDGHDELEQVRSSSSVSIFTEGNEAHDVFLSGDADAALTRQPAEIDSAWGQCSIPTRNHSIDYSEDPQALVRTSNMIHTLCCSLL